MGPTVMALAFILTFQSSFSWPNVEGALGSSRHEVPCLAGAYVRDPRGSAALAIGGDVSAIRPREGFVLFWTAILLLSVIPSILGAGFYL